MTYRAELLASTAPLACEGCPMSKLGGMCTTVARAALAGVIKEDHTYEPNTKIAPEVEATIIMTNSKNGEVAKTAAEVACKDLRALYQKTATESPMKVMA